jgi:hypothetical protein
MGGDAMAAQQPSSRLCCSRLALPETGFVVARENQYQFDPMSRPMIGRSQADDVKSHPRLNRR